MTDNGYPNRSALGAALDVYLGAMRPFVTRGLRRVPGADLRSAIEGALNDHARERFRRSLERGESEAGAIEAGDIPYLVERRWRDVFGEALRYERDILSLLHTVAQARNRVAHPGEHDIELPYAQARLTDMAEVLERVRAPEAAARVKAIYAGLEEPRAAPEPEPMLAAPAARTGRRRATGNLKPWREAARPNADITDGAFRTAEFMADLQRVRDGSAEATEYGDPIKFFERTHITPGMRRLLENVLGRIGGAGGDPVIQTKTGFGGGKTHSLIALYHLITSTGALAGARGEALAEVRGLAAGVELGRGDVRAAGMAVLVGTFLDPGRDATTDGGDPLDTLWGEMAWQLGGQEAYDIVGRAARERFAPGGETLDALLEHVGPCLILIDELVAYARNAIVDRDSLYTFVQNLTEAVRRSERAVLVATLPESATEAGDEHGAAVLAALDHIFGRIEATWEPLEVREAFEVVRRRLFGGDIDAEARDLACDAFSRMYHRAPRDYPQGTGEQRYLERMRECYPIHPEIFDRLYDDWSTISRFQRTRGVLRLMAHAISFLYRNDSPSPLILPGDLPFRDSGLANEFAPLLPGHWGPVFTEADADDGRADRLDASQQRYSEVGGAARRIARAVLLGSAPAGAVRGLAMPSIRLGVVQPGDGVSAYHEALQAMSGDLHYLYDDGVRHWFHAEENLNKVAADREGDLSADEITAYIVGKVGEAARRRGDVVVCPADSAAVPDEASARLVILHPDHLLPSRGQERDFATETARGMMERRGEAPRVHRNALLFLAARSDELRTLRASVRSYLAWNSIVEGERRIQGLEGERLRQARAALDRHSEASEGDIARAWRHVLVPRQPDARRAEYTFSELETDTPTHGDIVRAAFERLAEAEALNARIAPTHLANLLAEWVWRKGQPDHNEDIPVGELWAMLTANVYLPRLRNRATLDDCIRHGVAEGAFGLAAGVDEDSPNGYGGFVFGDLPADIPDDALVLEREWAEVVRSETPAPGLALGDDDDGAPGPDAGGGVREEPEDGSGGARGPASITVRVRRDDSFSHEDLSQLREEIARVLREDGGEVAFEVTVRASKDAGFSESAVRAVRENGAQLGLDIDIPEG